MPTYLPYFIIAHLIWSLNPFNSIGELCTILKSQTRSSISECLANLFFLLPLLQKLHLWDFLYLHQTIFKLFRLVGFCNAFYFWIGHKILLLSGRPRNVYEWGTFSRNNAIHRTALPKMMFAYISSSISNIMVIILKEKEIMINKR